MIFKDKVAIITGCNKGIGKAILEELSNKGATIFACSRKSSEEFLNNLNLSKIIAHEYTEQAINKIITDFTIKSALKNKLHKEKSVFEARPTAWDVISASIFKVSH